MDVIAGILATLLVLLFVCVQPFRGRRRYLALVEALKTDPGARRKFYARGIALQWVVVAVIGVIGAILARSPTSIGLTWHLRSSGLGATALVDAVAVVVGILISIPIVLRAGPGLVARLRRQAAGFAALLPRSATERRWFAAVAVTAGFCEEVIYRGFGVTYVRWLFPSSGTIAVVVVIGAAFGLAHLYQGPRNVVVTGLLGAFLTWITLVTGSLAPAIVIHTIIDLRVLAIPKGVAEAAEAPAS